METTRIGSTAYWSVKATGSGPVAETFDPGRPFELREIRFHDVSAAGGAGDLTVKIESAAGGEHNATILTQDMTSVQDLCATYDTEERLFCDRDSLKIAWANASSHGWGLEIIYK